MAGYFEKDDDIAITNFSFDQTGGTSKAIYYVDGPDAFILQNNLLDILGYTNPYVNPTQYLQRMIPATHPKFPYMFAAHLGSMVGIGKRTAIVIPPEPAPPLIGSNPIADYEQFELYEIGVDFAGPRTYPILADPQMPAAIASSYTDKAGNVNPFTYAAEYLRYTEFDYIQHDSQIQGQIGTIAMFVNGVPADIPFTSPPWFWLPDQTLKITWHQVPLRYITSQKSYIAQRAWRGRINQNAFWMWQPGELLYLGFAVKKYSPPFADVQITTNASAQIVYQNYAQLCDIELNFLFTRRRNNQTVPSTPANGNYVVGGHNLLPNLVDGNFYYATRNDAAGVTFAGNPPSWYSAPLELLWSDPDVGGIDITID